jgi:hypothetical protein
VKSAALSLAGELHVQLGPVVKAMMLSNIKDDSVKSQLEKKFDSCPYDASVSATLPAKKCLFEGDADNKDRDVGGATSALGMDLPKTDLLSELPTDIIDQLVRKEWRKKSIMSVSFILIT